MKYYFDQLDPVKFQQLINALLIERYGDDIRLTPLRGSDGGRDGETAVENPFMLFILDVSKPLSHDLDEGYFLRPGRYLFQVKHHDTSASRISDLRNVVVSEFEQELTVNVLPHTGAQRVNYFFLITNVNSSEQSINKVDEKRGKLLKSVDYLHADVWWGERVTALLDTMPNIWASFPELFPGSKVPLVGNLINDIEEEFTKTIRIFLNKQYTKDMYVKFRQVEIEHNLDQLFVDLEVGIDKLSPAAIHLLRYFDEESLEFFSDVDDYPVVTVNASEARLFYEHRVFRRYRRGETRSLIKLLTSEFAQANSPVFLNRLILEGGPGQGKSTITQMLAQIYRKALLKVNKNDKTRSIIKVVRLPFRIELREFAEFVDQDSSRSVEEYLAKLVRAESGGRNTTVNDIQSMVERSPIILIFDGLDEIGNDNLRNNILEKVRECISRFEGDLNCDLRVIITTRPPALAGHHELLQDFVRLPIAPLNDRKIEEYTANWLKVQIRDDSEKKRILTSFQRRLNDKHVRAIATNPMQLSILLHFIRIKGEAFPNNRAQLYKSYFETVIDRDVEKSVGISVDRREIVESLHKYLGYKIHAATEAKKSDGTFPRNQLLSMVSSWLAARGNAPELAAELFKLGEERLGLIVVTRGEGESVQYGFEIQPVREYFAAAFINDEIKGDVEPIFQHMLIRPFWSEVALFLGGLRRIREKANLILQAKDLDASSESGWLQHGRRAIMQLLQEGVFSQPPQAYQLALEFVTEALDPQIITRQLELENYVESLPELINQNTASDNVPRKQVLQMLKANRDTDDEYSLQRMYRVASRIVDGKTVDKIFQKYQNYNLDLLTKIKVVWPLIHGQLQPEDFQLPHNIPDEILSKWLWFAINRKPQLQTIPLPEQFHQLLLEEYALRPNGIMSGDQFTVPHSNWAVWHLDYLSNVLLWSLRGRPFRLDSSQLQEYIDKFSEINADYSGISESTTYVVSTLIEFMLITINLINDRKQEKIAERYDFQRLIEITYLPALDGWIAIRGANIILHALVEEPFFHHTWSRGENLEVERSGIIDFLHRLREAIGDEKTSFRKLFEFIEIPKTIYDVNRISLDVVELLILDIHNQLTDEVRWVSRLPLSLRFIPTLVSHFKNNLEVLLKWIGSKNDYLSTTRENRLHVSMQRAILGYVSNTNDVEVLCGALVALSTSSFINIAGVDNLLKLLAAGKNTSFATRIFNVAPHEQRQLDEKHAPTLESVARRILEKPEIYGLRLVAVAAKHVADYYPQQASPLMDQEEKLGISVAL
jgi:hypothetical protein